VILWGYALATALDLVAAGLHLPWLDWAVKPFLTLLLLAYVLRSGRPVPRALDAGLGCAFVGDVLLMLPGTVAFLAGMGAFLGMQVCYLVAFRRAGARPALPVALGYAVFWLAGNALLWPHLGGLAVPILVYSVALTAMAVLGAGLGRRIRLGALLFLVSDLMIGAGTAGLHAPAGGVLIMATYAAAQYLIVTGYLRLPQSARRLAERPVPA
jgi:uncharacterized membrane protein YhhN